jgi:hypothetical protein
LIVEADRKGLAPFDLDPQAVVEAKAIRDQLEAKPSEIKS